MVSTLFISIFLISELGSLNSKSHISSYSPIFGFSILDNMVITSGDFGYLTLVAGIGLIPSLVLLFFIGMLFIRASHLGNFAPFLILMIENIHYPIFVDPISAYILVQYAMHNNK